MTTLKPLAGWITTSCGTFFKEMVIADHFTYLLRNLYATQEATERVFDKIKHPLMIKSLQKAGIEGTYLNIIKVIYDKPTANVMLNGEKLKAFPLNSNQDNGAHSHHYYST